MAKQEIQPEPPEIDEVDAKVHEIMGPTPDEAAPSVPNFEEKPTPKAVAPTGPPEVTDEPLNSAVEAEPKSEVTSDISEVAAEINKSLEQSVPVVVSTTPDTEASVADNLDDPTLDAAVSDIVTKESDELLAAEDAKLEHTPPKESRKGVGAFFAAWWHNKKARSLTFACIAAAFLGLALFPATRYTILNTIGVRAGLSLKVIDSKYGVPVKNVEVVAGGQKGMTDAEGKVSLTNVRLGKTQLLLAKRSFATVNQTIIVGWGSNPYIDPIQMKPTGSEYSFIVTDWLSGKPVSKAEISDGESTAVTDDSGKATLTVQPTDKDLKLIVKSKGYRSEETTIVSTDKTTKAIKLVAGEPEVFVSKRSGKLDVYKRDVDGKNEVVLLPGTGTEQDPLGLLVNQDGTVAALVSTREGKRDKNGYLLSNLYTIDVTAKTVTKVPGTESAQIQLIDWIGDKLVFVKVAAGPSAATAGRQRVTTYDYKQEKQIELANANYFNDVEVYKGQVYYAPSAAGALAGEAAQLYRINADNSSKTSLLNKETWVTYRTSYDKMQVNASDSKWYEQTLGENKFTALSGAPASPTHRIYIDSPNGEKTVWVDNRDGKGVLILQDIKTPSNTDKVIFSKGGLGYPIRWLTDKHLLIRVSNSQETADYVLNIDGGEAQKVGDVTNTATTNRWYYYK